MRTDRHPGLDTQISVSNSYAAPPDPRHARWPHRTALVASTVRRLAGRTGRDLDIGCGSGLWFLALGCGWKHHGIEVAPQAAVFARQAGAEVFCGPVDEYATPTEPFDLITAFALLEHLPDPRRLVRRVAQWLHPGGLFVLMTGDRESKTARAMGATWPLYASPDHIHYFSARSVRTLLKSCGLDVSHEEWRFMYFPDSRPRPLARAAMKGLEILGRVSLPAPDHYYCYATSSPEAS
jgi:SAM-dependent methyltransferase